MEFEFKFVPGPASSQLKKEAAASKLEGLPGFPKNAQYDLVEIDGRWYAAVAWPKTAEFPPAKEDGGSGEEESGPPKSDEGEGKPESEGDEKPSSEGPPKNDEAGKGGEAHMLSQVFDMLTKITDALGLSDPSGMVPGADEGAMPPGPPHAGPPGSDPAMGKEPGVGADNKMHTVHERSLKPGEAPPGTTPVGAPAFASVSVPEDHPWKAAIEAGSKEFEVESEVGDEPLSTIASELKALAEPYGYIVTDLAPSGAGTQRVASARILRTR